MAPRLYPLRDDRINVGRFNLPRFVFIRRGGDEKNTCCAELVDTADYSFDTATTLFSTTLTVGGVGASPMDGVADELRVLPD